MSTLQTNYKGAWFYVTGICSNTVTTSYNKYEALSGDYLGLVMRKFPTMTFRSI